PGRRTECDARLPGARWYDSTDELLADAPVDFVDICTPPSSHAPLIRGALRRGLHVLCEKPLVCSVDEVRSLAQLAAASGRVLQSVDNWQHAPIIRQVRELLRGGEIGELSRVVWHTLRTRPAPAGDARRNWAELTGTAGRIELDGDTLTVTRQGSERRWSVPPPLSDGSWHPDWFDPVVDQFLAEVTGSAPHGSNLAEASLCVVLH